MTAAATESPSLWPGIVRDFAARFSGFLERFEYLLVVGREP
jgi:hypothetical protein